MKQQAQAVQQDQCLAAACHSVDDVESQIVGKSLVVGWQFKVRFDRCFLIVIQQIIGQTGLHTSLDRRADGHLGGDDHFRGEALAKFFQPNPIHWS